MKFDLNTQRGRAILAALVGMVFLSLFMFVLVWITSGLAVAIKMGAMVFLICILAFFFVVGISCIVDWILKAPE